MIRKSLLAMALLYAACFGFARAEVPTEADVVVVGGTPGGLMAAIAAAREGSSVLVLERSGHIGGLPANGLGATDITTRGATGGLFLEFVRRNAKHYREAYGADAPTTSDQRHDGRMICKLTPERSAT
jgi:flavin-dependent dehydrogenase